MGPDMFEQWNKIKQRIHFFREPIFCNPREIWWCYLGMNIGTEQNGKHDIFERPVLVTQVFSQNTCRIIPMTSKLKDDQHHMTISYEGEASCLILAQMRSISTKRLSRKIGRIDELQFSEIQTRFIESLQNGIPCISAEDSSEPEGMVS